MNYEVEQKFAIDDFALLEGRLLGLGADPGEPSEQIDTYFAHPARDFGQTDEALRMRRVDRTTFLTYKGPKIDAITKTRRELELPLPPGREYAEQFAEILASLGFLPVSQVRKVRHPFHLVWEGREVEAALDEVDHLGCYVELELAATTESLPDVQKSLASLVARLGLRDSERRSYLEMLLAVLNDE